MTMTNQPRQGSDMYDAVLIQECLKAWAQCEDASHWPSKMDCILIANFNGSEIFWPQFEGEVFSIVRLHDSHVLDEDELPSREANCLNWQALELSRVSLSQ